MNTNERTPNCTNIDRCRQGLLNVLKHHFLFRKLPLACCLLPFAFLSFARKLSVCLPIEDTHESLNSPGQVKQQLNLPRYVYSKLYRAWRVCVWIMQATCLRQALERWPFYALLTRLASPLAFPSHCSTLSSCLCCPGKYLICISRLFAFALFAYVFIRYEHECECATSLFIY